MPRFAGVPVEQSQPSVSTPRFGGVLVEEPDVPRETSVSHNTSFVSGSLAGGPLQIEKNGVLLSPEASQSLASAPFDPHGAPDSVESIRNRDISKAASTKTQVRDAFTGESRRTEFTDTLPEVANAPELNKIDFPSFAFGAGALLTRDQEALEGVLKKQFGDQVSFSEDQKGNIFATFPSGTYQLNKPGLHLADALMVIPEIGAGALGNVDRARRGITGLLRGAGAQAGLEATEAALGGDFDPLNIALAGIGGGVLGKLQGSGGVSPRLQTDAEKRIVAQIAMKRLSPSEAQTFLSKNGIDVPSPDVNDITPAGVERLEDVLVKDDVAAKFIIDGAGRLKASAAGRSAIRRGHDPGIVSSMLGADKKTTDAMNHMLNIQLRSLADADFAGQNRPSDVIGNLMQQRIDAAASVRKDAGSKLNTAARKLKNTSVDVDAAKSKLLDSFEEHGIEISGEGLDFSQSTFQVREASGPTQARIQAVYDKLFTSGIKSGFDAHTFKGAIDEMIPYSHIPQEGVSLQLETMLSGVRFELNNAIRDVSKDYAKQNDRIAPAITALNNLQSAVGRTIDLNAPSATSALGTASRKLLSNQQNRGKLTDSLSSLQAIARRDGIAVNGDINSLVKFASHLERTFGTNADNSLGGIIEKTNDLSARRANISSGPVSAAKQVVVDKAVELGESAIRLTDEDHIKTLRAVLREGR